MTRQRFPRIALTLLACAASLGAGLWAFAAGEGGGMTDDGMKAGKADLKSIGALTFGPGGVLFAADSEGAAVYAFDLGGGASGQEPREPVEDLDAKLAAMLGTGVRDVFIKDMAVHPATGAVYLSIMRGSGEAARPVLMRVSGAGEIAEVPLDEIRHAKLELADAPAPDAMRRSTRLRTLTVTDLELIDGELYIAGLSNEEFASTLRRVPFPFTGPVAATGLEIYHGAHGQYETHAPIRTFLGYELEGEPHLLASYLCTPLVTFPVEELRQKSKLRGKTLAELGWGNVPLDMIAYEHEGEEYILITNTRRGTMKLKATDIRAAQKRDGITTEVEPRTGVDYQDVPLGHVVQVADLDGESILVLGRQAENGALVLFPRAKRWL